MNARRAPRAPWSGPRDPGLQGERTALAWNRTGLALLVNGLLALRTGWDRDQPALTGVAVALLVAAAVAIAYGGWRRHHLVRADGSIAPPALAIAAAAAITWVACAAGLAAILVIR